MSVNRQFSSANDTSDSRSTNASFASDQDSIDRRLKQLKEEVLPFYPFLLTVPTDVPFRLGNRFVNNWAVGKDGPFTAEEQQLQYMTFLTHHEGDSLLVAVGDWSDGTGNIMAEDRSRPQSAASTPSSGSLKKKISLNDYKNKSKGGASASPNSNSSTLHVPDEKQRASKTVTTNPAQKQPSKTSPHPNSSTRPSSEIAGRKRPPGPDHEHPNSHDKHNSHTSSPKRPRLSPGRTTSSGRSNANGLPILLSPTLPATSNSPRLPRLLSPTLPPDIEKELSKIVDEPHRRDSPSFTKDDVLREKHTDSDKSHFDSHPSHSSKSHLSSQAIDKPGSTSKSQSSLVVKLKYGRTNRKRVEALLKFSGKKKPASSTSPVKDPNGPQKKEEPQSRKAPASDSLTSGSHPPEKKTKHVDDGRALQRERSNDSRMPGPEKSRTPATSGKANQTSLTPMKDHRASADVDEKGRSMRRSSRDMGAARLSPPHSSQVNKSRNSDRRAWKEEFQKLSNLGRELKHAAERHTAKEEKLAAATAIEAILCFILAFVADDQSKALARQTGDSSTWLSILAYWRVVKKNSTPYPQLYSLCLILGAVSYDAIHALDLERLAVLPLPGENTPAPTPGSDGANTDENRAKSARREFLDLKNRLLECFKESQRLWLEGTKGLSEDILMREFPKTWSNRSKDYSERGKQRMIVGDYTGDYFLPFGRTTTPLEVVRFTCAALHEWCSNENVSWSGRLGL